LVPCFIGVVVVLARSLSAQRHEGHIAGASLHGTMFLQYVRTFGPRAAYQLGSVNRLMVDIGGPRWGGVLRFRAMGSAEPLTLSDRGTPQPLQVAFTSDGRTITDRAHASPWIMELAASYERAIARDMTVSVYGAAIGEPALGPPVYLHRPSAAANAAVPLGHHAQDITHSSFGVVTLGLAKGRVRLEGSAFNDRQPDEPGTVFYYRDARLDAYAARATLAVRAGWSLASSYGYLPATSGSVGHSHGALHRVSVAAVDTRPPWFITIAYSANEPLGSALPSRTVLAETERRWTAGHALFARAEFVQRTDEELGLVGSVDERQDIKAFQVGYARALPSVAGNPARIGAHATLAIIPPQLEPFYGRRTPLTLAVYAQISWGSVSHPPSVAGIP
jgi:hypothetical protein